jgi:hypothetical protein
MDKPENQSKPNVVRTRHLVHIGFSFLMLFVILLINFFNDASVVSLIFKIAALTYGPLLGLYAFGLFVKTKTVNEYLVPIVCLLAPALTFLLSSYSKELFAHYEFAEELIIINGLITFVGLLFISKSTNNNTRF